ncbi:MAG: Bax inhibitor-1/YccA family protein [Candidatus Omnitrophota bacterium]
MRSGNPALRGTVFTAEEAHASQGRTMTIQGTTNKTLLLLLFTVLTASWVWGNSEGRMILIFSAVVLGLITAIITIVKKEWSGITAPVYALIEGIVIGGVSLYFERMYPGIVVQAVALTFGTLFCLLLAYKSRLIKATENFKLGVISATGAVALFYLISIILSFFGIQMTLIHDSGPFGIIFSLIVVSIAALNLVLDFDFIENGEKNRAPKYMEWYGAFGLIITLIWLYLEILRLLSKMRSR